MKCKKLSCEKEAKPGFECCSAIHGADVKLYRSQILEAGESGDKNTLGLYTIEEALAYA